MNILFNKTRRTERIPLFRRVLDSTTDLQYLRARWYDPNAGRFVSKDPYQGSIDNPLSLNRYSYVENNPIIYVDSTGNRKEHGVGSGGAGGGAGAIVPRGSTSPAPRTPITVTKSPSTSSSTFNLNKSMMKNIRNNTVQGLRDEKIMIRATRTAQNGKGTGNNTSVTVSYGTSNVNVYRGGNSFQIKSNEVKIDLGTGLVKTTHGVSLDTNPATVSKFGGAYRIDLIPNGLKIVQRGGRAEHFEIVPAYDMPLE